MANSDAEVVAFTATQIPNIDGRKYPQELAVPQYPLLRIYFITSVPLKKWKNMNPISKVAG